MDLDVDSLLQGECVDSVIKAAPDSRGRNNPIGIGFGKSSNSNPNPNHRFEEQSICNQSY